MRKNAIAILWVAVIICSFLPLVSRAQISEDAKALGREVVEKSGLHFAKSDTELFEFAQVQVSKPCDMYEVLWTAKREQELVPLNESYDRRVAQEFAVKARSKVESCGGALPPFEQSAVTLAIFGATDAGEIRGAQLIQQMRDPRMMIVECSQLYGKKPRAGEKCGMFVLSKATLYVRMPADPEIVKIHVLERAFSGPGQWRWEKLGIVDLRRE